MKSQRYPTCFVCATVLLRYRFIVMVAMASLLTLPTVGQDVLFGSIDDPSEQPSRTKWHSQTDFRGGAGFSLVGPQWYTMLFASFSQKSPGTFLQLSGQARTGVYGDYGPDTDENYDFLRLLNVARYQSRKSTVYVRVGPLQRVRLGHGGLVNFLNTDASYDDRTVGVEAMLSGQHVTLETFSEDILDIGLVGARLSLRPFSVNNSKLSSLSIGVSAVRDQNARLNTSNAADGQEADIRMEAYRTGGFGFFPFVSFSRLPEYGQGMAFGADIENDNFIDLAKIHFRLALHYNSSDFRTGYFGPFYTVSSHRASVLTEDESIIAGNQLRDIERGNSVETELRFMIFDRFELWYAFMRYHGVQRLSEYHLRLMFTSDRFNVAVSQDRRGLVGFFSLFDALADENRMRFEVETRVFGPLWAKVNAEYTYRRLYTSSENIPRYIIQRRFSPIVVLRYPSEPRR